MKMSEAIANKGFNWMGFLFAPYYYAGYGNIQKGIILAVISFIPLTQIIVGIYAGKKANQELPVGKQEFDWKKATPVIILHLVIVAVVLSFTSA
jgi:hypothetical protein